MYKWSSLLWRLKCTAQDRGETMCAYPGAGRGSWGWSSRPLLPPFLRPQQNELHCCRREVDQYTPAPGWSSPRDTEVGGFTGSFSCSQKTLLIIIKWSGRERETVTVKTLQRAAGKTSRQARVQRHTVAVLSALSTLLLNVYRLLQYGGEERRGEERRGEERRGEERRGEERRGGLNLK